MIWLLRHGDAEDVADDDASRRLTPKGERQSRAAGEALSKLEADIEVCLTSPKVRARQTAELACEALGVSVETTDALRGGDFDLDALCAGRGTCLLVGHEPDFSRAVALATGGRVEFKKGGLAAIDGATLKAMLRPDQIKRIAAS
jgi:phosphohistidine phosphatase